MADTCWVCGFAEKCRSEEDIDLLEMLPLLLPPVSLLYSSLCFNAETTIANLGHNQSGDCMRVHCLPEFYCLKGWSCGIGSVDMYMFGEKSMVMCSTYPCVDALGYDMEALSKDFKIQMLWA